MNTLSTFLFSLLWPLLPFFVTGNIIYATNTSRPTMATIGKLGCLTKCGNLSIPYPFGIGKECSIDPSFQINCTTFLGKPKPLIVEGNYEVTNISDSHVYIKNKLGSACYDSTGNVTSDNFLEYVVSAPYTFSDENTLTLLGCDDSVQIISLDDNIGCIALCSKNENLVEGSCNGIGCCQTAIQKGIKDFAVVVNSLTNHITVWSFNPCGFAFVGQQNKYKFMKSDLLDKKNLSRKVENVPVVLDWAIGTKNCKDSHNFVDYACHPSSLCIDADNDGIGGYRCLCPEGSHGNPYIDPGCQDIDECVDRPCDPKGFCINVPGSFNCTCQEGYTGDGRNDGQGCIQLKYEFPVIKFSLGVGFGFLFLIFSTSSLYFIIQRSKLKKQRRKFFHQNGGLLFKQNTKNNDNSMRSSKIFTSEELKKATHNYATDRILGKGGSGVVYKGILQDKRVVAIKKSLRIEEDDIESFINEVTILTRINHRNVVKLLGCCLETESPILVYEYVSHGTLYDRIHIHREDPWFSWPNRLRIASEAANALAYLHSAASVPIFHRDIKPANILLDEFHTVKIADFGTSRLLPADESQVMTLVQGTLGYMDPEYFITQQLTGKSDVYSLGVVIAELMTGRKPLSDEGEKNLATFFVTSVEANKLFEIIDKRVLREGSLEQLQSVAEFVLTCLNVSGEKRPTMIEVASGLERLRNLHVRQQIQEDEIFNQVTSTPDVESDSDLYTCSTQKF